MTLLFWAKCELISNGVYPFSQRREYPTGVVGRW
jgi:hypothetical protein